MKVQALILFGCLTFMVMNQCNVQHCADCPDRSDVCGTCDTNYHLEGSTCQPGVGHKGETTLTHLSTKNDATVSGPFFKIVGQYILTHDYEVLEMFEIQNGVPVSLGTKDDFILIFDADMEMVNGEILLVANDAGSVIRVLTLENSVPTQKDYIATNDFYNRVDLSPQGNLAITYSESPKVELYSYDIASGEFQKDDQFTTANSNDEIQSVKVCPDGSILLTVKTATTMDLQMFEKNSIYANAQTLHLNEPTVAGIADSSSCSSIAVLKSDSGAISVLEKAGGQYGSTLDDIVVGSELEKVMVNEDMDIIVARTADAGSKVYKFDMCSEKYEQIQEFDNTHEGLTIGGGYIVSKTESGLELQSYTSQAILECPCDEGFIKVNGECVCPVGQFDDAGTCTNCIDNCHFCSTTSNCITCAPTYKVQGNECVCDDGYFENSGTCEPCIDNCYTCSDSATCDECYPSFVAASSYPTGGCCKTGSNWPNAAGSCSLCSAIYSQCSSCFYQSGSTFCEECTSGFGLVGSKTACVSCSSIDVNCERCTDDVECTRCASGFTPNNDGSVCVACITFDPNCQACSHEGCSTCRSGFDLTDQKTCQDCTTISTNCVSCLNGQCLSCEFDYGVTVGGTGCTLCSNIHSSCNTCSEGLCTKCDPSFALSSDSLSCVACDTFDANCVSCLHNQCTECAPAYGLNTQSQTCGLCSSIHAACTSCENDICQACEGRHFPTTSGDSCITCTSIDPNCVTCNQNTCQSCSTFFGVSTDGLSCTLCSSIDANCRECSEGSCTRCELKFGLTSGGQCQQCSEISENCESCELGVCNFCAQGFGLKDGVCVQCSEIDPNCRICTGDACVKCEQRFGINADQTLCLPCSDIDDNCRACSQQNCYQCADGFGLDGNTCFPCSTINDYCHQCTLGQCTQCQPGFGVDADKVTCSRCADIDLKCIECAAGACSLCDYGYALNDDGVCQPCSDIHEECVSCDPTSCLSCSYGYQPSPNMDACLPCSDIDENCVSCSGSKCTRCQVGYGLTFPGTGCSLCRDIDPSCIICSAGLCDKCANAFSLNAAKDTCTGCDSILPNCDSCTSIECLDCASGYGLSADGNSCQLCTSIDPQCSSCTSGVCQTCIAGFGVSDGGISCMDCSTIDSECTSCYSGICSACSSGYGVSSAGDTCEQCPASCATCTADKCLTCAIGYGLNDDETLCVDCSLIHTECTSCFSGICTSCASGYGVNGAGDACQPCPPDCLLCYSGICTLCASSYGLTPARDACIPCSEIDDECLVCHSYICSSCDIGFDLLGAGYQCEPCSAIHDNCKACEDDVCLKCDTGFAVTSDGTSCTACSTIPNCEECEYNNIETLVCTNCGANYNVVEDRCEQSGGQGVVDEYGLKSNLQITEITSANDAIQFGRSIDKILLAPQLIISAVKYQGLKLRFASGTSRHLDHQFISDFDYHPGASLLVAATYAKHLLFATVDGQALTLAQPLSTHSQILHVDLNLHENLLAGYMNGDLVVYSPGSPYSDELTIPHAGGRVEGAKLCNDGSILALVEEGGFFTFYLYSSTGTELYSRDLTELVGVYLDATDDCSSVVISSTFLMKAEIMKKNGAQYEVMKEFQETHPVGKTSMNPDGDMIIIPLLSNQVSKVYRYNSCTDDFESVELSSTKDPSTAAISHQQLAIGTVTGQMRIYTQDWDIESCDSFGKKVNFVFDHLPTDETASRSIVHLHLSGDLILAAERHSSTELFQITDSGLTNIHTFDSDIFTSDADLNSAEECYVISSHRKNAYVYRKQQGVYTLNHTIVADSQLISVDMSGADCSVLLGHRDGSITLHQPSNYDAKALNIQNDGYSILQNKVCSDGSVLALAQKDGNFFFRHFSSTGEQAQDQIPITDEHIEVFLAATDDCRTVVIAGITLSKALIFNLVDEVYIAGEIINDGHPLSAVDINQQGDLILVSRIANHDSSVLYKHRLCEGSFIEEEVIESGDYDESNALNSEFIVQGNEDGTIKVTKYNWQFESKCPISQALPTQQPRSKQFNANDSIREDETKRLESKTNLFKNQAETENNSVLISFVVISVVVLASIAIIVKMKKKKVTRSFEETETPETNSQFQETTV